MNSNNDVFPEGIQQAKKQSFPNPKNNIGGSPLLALNNPPMDADLFAAFSSSSSTNLNFGVQHSLYGNSFLGTNNASDPELEYPFSALSFTNNRRNLTLISTTPPSFQRFSSGDNSLELRQHIGMGSFDYPQIMTSGLYGRSVTQDDHTVVNSAPARESFLFPPVPQEAFPHNTNNQSFGCILNQDNSSELFESVQPSHASANDLLSTINMTSEFIPATGPTSPPVMLQSASESTLSHHDMILGSLSKSPGSIGRKLSHKELVSKHRRSKSSGNKLSASISKSDLVSLPTKHKNKSANSIALSADARKYVEKPFVCNVDGCDASFSRMFNLKSHMVSHNTAKPHVCELNCGSSFARRHDLLRHMRNIHAEGRKHQCPMENCDLLFGRTDQLRRHLKTQHKLAKQEAQVLTDDIEENASSVPPMSAGSNPLESGSFTSTLMSDSPRSVQFGSFTSSNQNSSSFHGDAPDSAPTLNCTSLGSLSFSESIYTFQNPRISIPRQPHQVSLLSAGLSSERTPNLMDVDENIFFKGDSHDSGFDMHHWVYEHTPDPGVKTSPEKPSTADLP